MSAAAPLLNSRHEAFATVLSKGCSKTDAYCEVYGVEKSASAMAAACRLSKYPQVAERARHLASLEFTAPSRSIMKYW